MVPNTIPLYYTMTNPSHNALMNLLNDVARNPKPTVVGFKIIYVGKDEYPISVLEMTPVEADRWK